MLLIFKNDIAIKEFDPKDVALLIVACKEYERLYVSSLDDEFASRIKNIINVLSDDLTKSLINKD